MPKLRISKYLRVQSVGGTDRDASISPTGPQLLETESTGDGKLARRRAVSGASMTHPLLPRVSHVFFRFKQGSDIYGLSTPQISMNGPIQCQLEASSVQGAGDILHQFPSSSASSDCTNQTACLLAIAGSLTARGLLRRRYVGVTLSTI